MGQMSGPDMVFQRSHGSDSVSFWVSLLTRTLLRSDSMHSCQTPSPPAGRTFSGNGVLVKSYSVTENLAVVTGTLHGYIVSLHMLMYEIWNQGILDVSSIAWRMNKRFLPLYQTSCSFLSNKLELLRFTGSFFFLKSIFIDGRTQFNALLKMLCYLNTYYRKCKVQRNGTGFTFRASPSPMQCHAIYLQNKWP
jgi:hypothetical protein